MRTFRPLSLTQCLAPWLLLGLPLGGLAQAILDEAKVPSYTLPDPLRTQGGQSVTSVKTWETVRRPELLRLFEENVYGRTPRLNLRFRPTVTREDPAAMNGQAHLREVTLRAGSGKDTLAIRLVLFTPNAVRRPPVFLLINNRGRENTDPTRVVKSDFWPAEAVVARGYAVAAFHVSDLAPDDKTAYQTGVLRLHPESLTRPDGMKALGAWAWGASRVLDYFEQAGSVDAKKVVVVGHSRGGKAALWCGAQDPRVAITVSNESGCGGAALSKRIFGETVKRINDVFPHWFCDNFRRFNDREANLPVDQHQLIALVAPRPVYVASAAEDLHADPKGEFLALKAAEPVYALHGIAPMPVATQPAVDAPVANTHLGYHVRAGGHNLTRYDWEQYLNFADFHFKK